MPDSRYDLLVIGGGLIGLATAREALLRAPGRRVVLLEKENRIAAHQSRRNSGVIHSGVYYRPGSLKARTCVEGRAELLDFCKRHGIPFELCGKVIVALDDAQVPILHELMRRGEANGVAGLSLVGRERLGEIEPHASGVRALHIPGSGITDYSLVAARLAERVCSRGCQIRTGACVTALVPSNDEVVVESTAGTFGARRVVNCAGLHSDRVARLSGARTEIRIVPFRGEYRQIGPRAVHMVRGMIYPVPNPALPFLGLHLNRRVDGTVTAGPNAVLAFSREGYRRTDLNALDLVGALGFSGFWRLLGGNWRHALSEVHRSLSGRAFLRSLQRLIPELEARDLLPGGSGVRAQAIDRSGRLIDDFRFIRTGGITHVLNVPSPAATACLAIVRLVVDLVERG